MRNGGGNAARTVTTRDRVALDLRYEQHDVRIVKQVDARKSKSVTVTPANASNFKIILEK